MKPAEAALGQARVAATPTPALAYGLLGLPLAFGAMPIYVHVPRYYAEVAGMELAVLGAILLATRLIDAGIDPWLGQLADRMPRPRLLAFALLPFVFGFVALLHPPAGVDSLCWLLGSLLLTCTGYSAATIAYQAWGADLGADAGERTRLTAWREGCTLAGVILAAALPGLLAPTPTAGVRLLAWVLPVLLLVAIVGAFSRLGSGRPSASLSPQGGRVRDALADPAFRRLLLIFLANGIAAAIPATLFLFYVEDVLHAASAAPGLLVLYFACAALSLPLWLRVVARHGRVVAWFGAMLLALAAFAAALLLGPGDVLAFGAVCALTGIALGADLSLPAAIAADLGERRGQAGACFGLWNFVAKLNLALAAGLALPLLGLLGYTPGQAGVPTALIITYAGLPLVFKTLAAVLLWRWQAYLEIRP
ncbi:MFS transporter [Dechloromonas sp. ZS-1]|uniref:MFS transporter n=1 Tax=Dechloromonas sp. ZS-1 TaxID=3138067 RepID=UPI0031FCC969